MGFNLKLNSSLRAVLKFTFFLFTYPEVPRISDLDTSSDMTKNFDMDADLKCYASGRPTPLVKWTRMAGELLPGGGTEFQVVLLSMRWNFVALSL